MMRDRDAAIGFCVIIVALLAVVFYICDWLHIW